jgi:hypothetical protein
MRLSLRFKLCFQFGEFFGILLREVDALGGIVVQVVEFPSLLS